MIMLKLLSFMPMMAPSLLLGSSKPTAEDLILADRGTGTDIEMNTNPVFQPPTVTKSILKDSSESALPEGWLEAICPNSGKPYWYHASTKEATWDRPGEKNTASQNRNVSFSGALIFSGPAAEDSDNGLPANWMQYTAPSGKPYWYNTKTKETTYDRPKAEDAPFTFNDRVRIHGFEDEWSFINGLSGVITKQHRPDYDKPEDMYGDVEVTIDLTTPEAKALTAEQKEEILYPPYNTMILEPKFLMHYNMGVERRQRIGKRLKTKTVTATAGFPEDGKLGIHLEPDGITFKWASDDISWVGRNTNLCNFIGKNYRFVMVNDRPVDCREEFDQAIAALSAGDSVTFILEKNAARQEPEGRRDGAADVDYDIRRDRLLRPAPSLRTSRSDRNMFCANQDQRQAMTESQRQMLPPVAEIHMQKKHHFSCCDCICLKQDGDFFFGMLRRQKDKKVVITSDRGFPNDKKSVATSDLGIKFDDEGRFTFEKCIQFGWAHLNTILDKYNVANTKSGRYRFTKVNDFPVQNEKEFDAVITSLNPHLPMTFTIEKPENWLVPKPLTTSGVHFRIENIPEHEIVVGGPESDDFCRVVAKWKARPYVEMFLRITVCHPLFSLSVFTLSFAWPSIFLVDGIDLTLFSTLWVLFRQSITDTSLLRDLVKPLITTGAATTVGIVGEAVLNYRIQKEVDEYFDEQTFREQTYQYRQDDPAMHADFDPKTNEEIEKTSSKSLLPKIPSMRNIVDSCCKCKWFGCDREEQERRIQKACTREFNEWPQEIEIKAKKNAPYHEKETGIRFEKDGKTFQWAAPDSWAGKWTNILKYNDRKYRFVKVNGTEISNKSEFDEIIDHLGQNDPPPTFTLQRGDAIPAPPQLDPKHHGLPALYDSMATQYWYSDMFRIFWYTTMPLMAYFPEYYEKGGLWGPRPLFVSLALQLHDYLVVNHGFAVVSAHMIVVVIFFFVLVPAFTWLNTQMAIWGYNHLGSRAINFGTNYILPIMTGLIETPPHVWIIRVALLLCTFFWSGWDVYNAVGAIAYWIILAPLWIATAWSFIWPKEPWASIWYNMGRDNVVKLGASGPAKKPNPLGKLEKVKSRTFIDISAAEELRFSQSMRLSDISVIE